MKKKNYVAFMVVRLASPNSGTITNRPNQLSDGRGYVTDVAIKRKLRNRLQDMGQEIYVQSEERCQDGYKSLFDRYSGFVSENFKDGGTKDEIAAAMCEKWLDVRAFGVVVAGGKIKDGDGEVLEETSEDGSKKKNKKGKNAAKGGAKGVSIGVRGPLTVNMALSVSPVDIETVGITKSVNGETTSDGAPSSDRMGKKHLVEFGLYKIEGSIGGQLAEKTGFTEEDAELIKEALRTLFVNDESAARPDGSMWVDRIYWFDHDCRDGQYSSRKVFDSVKAVLKDGVVIPTSVDDYDFVVTPLEGLEPEVIEGF